MLPHSSFAVAVVRANFSIIISHYQQQVMLRDSGYFILELFIPVVAVAQVLPNSYYFYKWDPFSREK